MSGGASSSVVPSREIPRHRAGARYHGVPITVSKTAVPALPLLWEVTARPRNKVPVRLAKVMVDPGTVVQVTPSGEVAAAYVVPVRVTRRKTGATPATAT